MQIDMILTPWLAVVIYFVLMLDALLQFWRTRRLSRLGNWAVYFFFTFEYLHIALYNPSAESVRLIVRLLLILLGFNLLMEMIFARGLKSNMAVH